MASATLLGNDVGQELLETFDNNGQKDSWERRHSGPLTIFPLARRRVPMRRLMNFRARLS